MAKSLKNPSCFLYRPGIAKIEDAPYPVIEDQHDVIVRIAYVGVCGSDAHFWNEGGIINKLRVGGRVAIEPGQPCRRCKTCKAGRYNLCQRMKFASNPPYSHGALTKYFKMPDDFCYKLPDSMELTEGVLVEPLAVAVHASRLADIKSGQSAVIFGVRTVGLLCAAVAIVMGAGKVVAVDVNDSRLEFVQGFASACSYHPAKDDTAEDTARKIVEASDLDKGADVVIEATGVSSCIEAGILTLTAGGSFFQVGLGKSTIEFPIVRLSEKEISMKGCFRYSAGDYDLALHLLQSGKISVKKLTTGIEPFERATDTWERTKQGDGIKALIQGQQD